MRTTPSGRIVRRAAVLAVAAGAAGCAPARAVEPPTARLSPDSAAALAAALRLVRPAYATQAEALGAGVYRPASAPTPAPATPAAAPPAAAPSADTAEFVIQVGAYLTREAAEAAMRRAGESFPGLRPVLEVPAPDLFRVLLGAWPTAAAAEGRLAEVRRAYPGAWVRRRAPQ